MRVAFLSRQVTRRFYAYSLCGVVCRACCRCGRKRWRPTANRTWSKVLGSEVQGFPYPEFRSLRGSELKACPTALEASPSCPFDFSTIVFFDSFQQSCYNLSRRSSQRRRITNFRLLLSVRALLATVLCPLSSSSNRQSQVINRKFEITPRSSAVHKSHTDRHLPHIHYSSCFQSTS